MENVVVRENEIMADMNSTINLDLLRAIETFHTDRCVMLKNLPPDIETKGIHSLFSELMVSVKDMIFNLKNQTAKVLLSSGKEYEIIAKALKHNVKFVLQNTSLHVSLSNNETLLCLSNLPPSFDENTFLQFVSKYGPVCHAFLMFNEFIGLKCGYGFVKYVSREVANQAKNLLFLKNVEGHDLHCDWVDSNSTSYKDLYSSCLFANNLPSNYFDTIGFRELFSKIAKPPYCQIAMKSGRPAGFGVIEYNSVNQCTQTFASLRDKITIQDQNIQLFFCAPGTKAINIVNRLINRPHQKEGLLPDPPAATAYLSQLQLMALQKPEVSSKILGMVSKEVRSMMDREGTKENLASQSKPRVIEGHHNSSGMQLLPPSLNVSSLATIANPNAVSMSDPYANTFLLNENGIPIVQPNALAGINDLTLAQQIRLQNQLNPIFIQNQTHIPISSSPQVFRRPLADRISPSDNRFSPYARSSRQKIWDYSPVSSRNDPKYTSLRNRAMTARTPHILPSPECSPDNLYVGQHSQGIGGHYADSYLKKNLPDP